MARGGPTVGSDFHVVELSVCSFGALTKTNLNQIVCCFADLAGRQRPAEVVGNI